MNKEIRIKFRNVCFMNLIIHRTPGGSTIYVMSSNIVIEIISLLYPT